MADDETLRLAISGLTKIVKDEYGQASLHEIVDTHGRWASGITPAEVEALLSLATPNPPTEES